MNFKKRNITFTNRDGSKEKELVETLGHLAIGSNGIIGGWDVIDIGLMLHLKTCKTKLEAKQKCKDILKALKENRVVEL